MSPMRSVGPLVQVNKVGCPGQPTRLKPARLVQIDHIGRFISAIRLEKPGFEPGGRSVDAISGPYHTYHLALMSCGVAEDCSSGRLLFVAIAKCFLTESVN